MFSPSSRCRLAEAIWSAPDRCRVCYRRSDGSRDDCRLDRGCWSRQPFGQHDRGAARCREADCLSLGRGGCPEEPPRLRHRRREHVASPAHGRARALHRGDAEAARGVAGRLPRTGQEQLAGGLHRDDQRPVDQVRAERLPAGQPGHRQGDLPPGRQQHLPPAAAPAYLLDGLERVDAPPLRVLRRRDGLGGRRLRRAPQPRHLLRRHRGPDRYVEDFGAPPKAVCLDHDLPMGTTARNDTSAFDARPGRRKHPRFNFVVPNDCENGHDPCGSQRPVPPVRRVLQREVPKIVASPAWDSRSVIDMTWDEQGDATPHDRRVGERVDRPAGEAGRLPGDWTHASLLRTLEDQFGLAHIHRARTAPVIGTIRDLTRRARDPPVAVPAADLGGRGCNGVGENLAQQLVAGGETVLDGVHPARPHGSGRWRPSTTGADDQHFVG